MKLVVKHGSKSIALEKVQEDATAAVRLRKKRFVGGSESQKKG